MRYTRDAFVESLREDSEYGTAVHLILKKER